MTKTILLVEDNPTDEKLTVRAFKKSNIENEVVIVRDGAEALEHLLGAPADGQAKELPAVVLLDLNLPRVSGLEVLRRLRADERTRLLPVVILTSSKQDQDLVTGYALGANAYVRKPVDFGEFVEAARTLGLFWLLLNEPAPSKASAR
ncbi:MAG: response regulator [Polyangiaceae bacterium]